MDQKPTEYHSTFTTVKQKKPVALIVVTLLLVLLTGGLGAVYYLKTTEMNNKISALQSQVDSSNVKLAAAEKQASTTKATATTEYQYIPELGVKYKNTTADDNLTYAYSTHVGGITREGVLFSTKTLTNVVVSTVAGESTYCTSERGPSGTILRYKSGDANEPKVGDGVTQAVKKVGEYMFAYAPSQAPCGVNAQNSDLQTSITSVKAIYDSLEAI